MSRAGIKNQGERENLSRIGIKNWEKIWAGLELKIRIKEGKFEQNWNSKLGEKGNLSRVGFKNQEKGEEMSRAGIKNLGGNEECWD